MVLSLQMIIKALGSKTVGGTWKPVLFSERFVLAELSRVYAADRPSGKFAVIPILKSLPGSFCLSRGEKSHAHAHTFQSYMFLSQLSKGNQTRAFSYKLFHLYCDDGWGFSHPSLVDEQDCTE